MEPPDIWSFPSGQEFLQAVRTSPAKSSRPELFKQFISASTIRNRYQDLDNFDLLLKEHSTHVIKSQANAKELFDKLASDDDRCAILSVVGNKMAKKVAHGNSRIRRSCSQMPEPAENHHSQITDPVDNHAPVATPNSSKPVEDRMATVSSQDDKLKSKAREDRARRTIIIDNIPIDQCGESKVIDAIAKAYNTDITISKLSTLPRNGVEVVCGSASEANLLLQDLSSKAFNGYANVHRSAAFYRLFPNEPRPDNRSNSNLKVLCWELPTDLTAEQVMEDWSDNVSAAQKIAEPGKRPYFVLHMKSTQLVKQISTDGLRWKIKMVRGKMARSNKVPRCIKCQGYFHNVHQCTNRLACSYCSGNHLYGNCMHLKDAQRAKCANCDGNHSAAYSKCPQQLAAQAEQKAKLLSRISRPNLGNNAKGKDDSNQQKISDTQWIPAPPPSTNAWPRLPTMGLRPRSDSTSSSKRVALSSTDDLRTTSLADLNAETLTLALIRAFENQQVIQAIKKICHREISAMVGNDMDIDAEVVEDNPSITSDEPL